MNRPAAASIVRSARSAGLGYKVVWQRYRIRGMVWHPTFRSNTKLSVSNFDWMKLRVTQATPKRRGYSVFCIRWAAGQRGFGESAAVGVSKVLNIRARIRLYLVDP
jgi:hypothetical protein